MRNPRHAYDNDGREIPPATIADIKALRCRVIEATCQKCGHEAIIAISDAPDDLAAPDAALRLRCSVCSSRDIRTTMNMAEYYEALRATTG
jgi:hypothetical protein